MGKVVILGSLNIDLVAVTEKQPELGETIIGQKFAQFIGGKGANQAAAASNMNIETIMLGKVGNDQYGELLISSLKEFQVNCDYIESTDTSTGIASIVKTPKDNCIIVIPGANYEIDENYIDQSFSLLEENDILLVQLEIPILVVKYACQKAQEMGVKIVINPAPYDNQVLQIIPFADIITPNEHEFQRMYGQTLSSVSEYKQAIFDFSKKNQVQIIVTLGAKGVLYCDQKNIYHEPAPKVNVVDTTGAGDTFNGVLVALIIKGYSLLEAIKYATNAASLSCTKLGAQSGMPTFDNLKKYIIE